MSEIMRPENRLPFVVRASNLIAESVGLSRWKRFSFDESSLCKRVSENAGLSDFGDPYFREGLRVLLKSLEMDAQLHPLGRIGLRGMVETQLENRLLFVDQLKHHPERFKQGPGAPVIVLGIPRSGTTLLHRLLALDEEHHAPRFWELMRPFASFAGDTRKRDLERALNFRQWLTPEVDSKHFSRADSAEECMWLLNLTFTSHGYWVAAPVYSYLDWLGSCDRRRAYAEYRLLLRALQSADAHRRLVLKAPSHSGSLEELLEAIPDALIIQTHRDPLQALASLNSLIYTVHRSVCLVDSSRMARANLRLVTNEMNRVIKARKQLPGRVFDVRYEDLESNPFEVVRSIYDHYDLKWTRGFENCLRSEIQKHPKGKHGLHTYSLEQFGLSRTDVLNHLGAYRRQLRLG